MNILSQIWLHITVFAQSILIIISGSPIAPGVITPQATSTIEIVAPATTTPEQEEIYKPTGVLVDSEEKPINYPPSAPVVPPIVIYLEQPKPMAETETPTPAVEAPAKVAVATSFDVKDVSTRPLYVGMCAGSNNPVAQYRAFVYDQDGEPMVGQEVSYESEAASAISTTQVYSDGIYARINITSKLDKTGDFPVHFKSGSFMSDMTMHIEELPTPKPSYC